MNNVDFFEHPHQRKNSLNGDWVLVSPHRAKRPWQGKVETASPLNKKSYDETCYLCPGNTRADGTKNEPYTKPFSFVNDFSALLTDTEPKHFSDNLLEAKTEQGICKVLCFSPQHHLTLPLLSHQEIVDVIALWKAEFMALQQTPWIKYIQIFENKGDVMGCSNPHPHGQIWAQSSLPTEIAKEDRQQKDYYQHHQHTLLSAYTKQEIDKQERLVLENEHFILVVPFWAIWPYETLLISKRPVQTIVDFSPEEQIAFAQILKQITTRYDNLFQTSFPYSAGMHQAPVNSGEQAHWHWHMHFYPPLLRSATVKKFMVGYELLASAQRDISPESAAATLRSLSDEHYSKML